MAYDDDPKPKPNKPPGPPPKDKEEGGGGGDIIGKATGFNYTQRWGSQRGQSGAFHMGGRPPAKADWDVMSPEERAAVGVPDWDTWSKAHEAWQGRHKVGGDIYGERTKMAEAIVGSGATTWDQVKQALLRAGFSESIHEQGPMFKQLQMAFEGASDPSGRYHWTPGGWVDVSTSDLAKRGIPGMADFSGPRLSGMDAIYGALPQTHDIRRFQQWLNNPKANAYGLNQYKHTGADGEVMYGTGRYQYDQFGNIVDTSTGQRVGHYYPGDTRAHYGGGGTGIDWGNPTMPTQPAGGGGGANPLQGLFGEGGGSPANMEALMKELAKILGIQLPAEDLSPKIIPNALMPGQPSAPGINGIAKAPGLETGPQPAQQIPPAAPANDPMKAQMPMAQPAMAQPSQTAAWGTQAPPVQGASAAGIFGTPSPTTASSVASPNLGRNVAPRPDRPSPRMETPYEPQNILQPMLRRNQPRRPRVLGTPTSAGLYGTA